MSYFSDLKDPSKRRTMKLAMENVAGGVTGKLGVTALSLGLLGIGAAVGQVLTPPGALMAGGAGGAEGEIVKRATPALAIGATGLAAFLLRKPLMKGLGGLFEAKTFAHGAAKFGVNVGRTAVGAASEIERMLIRPIMTGRSAAANPVDAYLPGWNQFKGLDHRRFGLNPTIGRRAIALGMGSAVLAGGHEALKRPAPPPMVYHDGVSVRHKNDQGVNAQYGMKIMGSQMGPPPMGNHMM